MSTVRATFRSRVTAVAVAAAMLPAAACGEPSVGVDADESEPVVVSTATNPVPGTSPQTTPPSPQEPAPPETVAAALGACSSPPAPEPTVGSVVVDVYLLCWDEVEDDLPRSVPVPRVVPATEDLEPALVVRSLLSGIQPDEEARGLSSWFSEDTAGRLNRVALADGILTVNFAEFAINNASTSSGSRSFLTQIGDNLFQYPEVAALWLEFDGDCGAFWGSMESGCHLFTRDDHGHLRYGYGDDLLPEPPPLPNLPDVGVAIEIREGVVLLTLEGSELALLPGYGLTGAAGYPPGPLPLTTPEGASVVLDPAAKGLVPDRPNRTPLSGGELVTLPAGAGRSAVSHAVVTPDRIVLSATGVQAEISAERDIVTLLQLTDDASAVGAADLVTGSTQAIPASCWVADRSNAAWLLICNETRDDGTWSTIESLDPAGLRTTLAGPAWIPGEDIPPAGFWRWAMLSPDGATLLAQWSGECEIPNALFIDLAGGLMTPVTGEESIATAPESFALGWTPGGDAVVLVWGGLCGNAGPPGVYLIPPGGAPSLIYALTTDSAPSAMWRASERGY